MKAIVSSACISFTPGNNIPFVFSKMTGSQGKRSQGGYKNTGNNPGEGAERIMQVVWNNGVRENLSQKYANKKWRTTSRKVV